MKMPEATNDENIEGNKKELRNRIKALKGLVENEEQLHVRTDDNFMLRYLRCSRYDPEEALRKVSLFVIIFTIIVSTFPSLSSFAFQMKTYYSLKKQHPQWFATPSLCGSCEKDLSDHAMFILDEKDRSGKSVYFNKLGKVTCSDMIGA